MHPDSLRANFRAPKTSILKPQTTAQVMLWVIVALIPGILVQISQFGFGVLLQIVSCTLGCVAAEALILKLRSRPILKTLKDFTAVLTGVLLALALPPTLPIWATLMGAFFAIIVAKQLYGGLGFNPFNPAMAGYVFLLIAYPVLMSDWPAPSATAEAFLQADAITSATPLDYAKSEKSAARLGAEITADREFNDGSFLDLPGGFTWINLAYLAGGIVLLLLKIVRFGIPIGILLGIVLTSLVLMLTQNDLMLNPLQHLFIGATMIGAFFIATDPVSAATTPKGRWYYGLLIGILIVLIRELGSYPDAIAFAVLIANCAVPMIDHYTKPVVYGRRKKEGL